METCPICKLGTMESQTIEALFKKGGRWVAIKGVPALVCDECGETSYPQETVRRIQSIINGDEAPCEFTWTPRFEFDVDAGGRVAPSFTTSLERHPRQTVHALLAHVLAPTVSTAVETIDAA